jgi:hypothetical protein
VVQAVPGGLRPRIFLTFGTTRVVGCQPYAPAVFTPGEFPGTNFQRLNRPQGTWFRRQLRKISPVVSLGNFSVAVTPPGMDPGTSRLVAQCLNHYATPGPLSLSTLQKDYFLGCDAVVWLQLDDVYHLTKQTTFQSGTQSVKVATVSTSRLYLNL